MNTNYNHKKQTFCHRYTCLVKRNVVSNQQISTTLNIVESTVRFHANNIFGKLNVSDV
ncbi:response regulator transcription factor [Iningainema sp. BLCCT55]|uniref:Response regulator transcription factor n=1 Tax=Iningainema tapete BLCC-T55 TaxID=2748662 RepID=A0A8J6XIT6_9CYAN|nr:response regulator transcription factor [Iningainema tapete BLCC-T55]